MSARHSRDVPFVVIELRAAERDAAERAAAEAFAAGAVGLEEREPESSGGGEEPFAVAFAIYAPAALAAAVEAALAAEDVRVSAPAPVPDVDWSERWKQGLSAIVVSPRLMLRPSFDTTPAQPGQCVLEIDPGQAFGTGGHESTRLALACVDTIVPRLPSSARVLDVGTGTGVLALAALALGCGRVCALDRDPLAAVAAGANAVRNGLRDRLDLLVGTPEALAPEARFDWLLANLLLGELEPLLPAFARLTPAGGGWIVSGLVEAQVERWQHAAAAFGVTTERALRRRDASGVEWIALVMRRRPARARRAAAARG